MPCASGTPDGIDVKVVENADDRVHITLPAPPAGDDALSDDELSNAAGGWDPNISEPMTACVRHCAAEEAGLG